MPPVATTAEALVAHLKVCGYGDAHIERSFQVDRDTIDVVAFAGKPWDSWSACLAAVNYDGDSRRSAAKARALGVASVFVCGSQGIDWWGMGAGGPTTSQPIAWPQVGAVFRARRDELSPSRIYGAKLRRPGSQGGQLWFFDAGLMPAVEKNRGQTLLRLVENAIGVLQKELGARLNSRQAQEDAYRTVFWQLAAKILHDKRVPNFINIDLRDVVQVFERIGRHHGETDRFPPFGREGRPAIDAVATTMADCGSLADVSSESIAYVYENALIDSAAGKTKKGEKSYDIRKELGIHSTPSVLIHHMLAQLWPMIEEIDPDDRHVFEPACGHAPFLTGAMRWLRQWDKSGQSTTSHDYMRRHLNGLETDAFAIELAKLALTLADEPHGNSWAITSGDMFLPGALAKPTKRGHILLSNPPYESFSPSQRHRYAREGEGVTATTIAVEMLRRTLPQLSAGSVFGVVVPQGVLHDKESKPIREELLAEFDLTEIGVFADNLFEHGDQEVAVLLGRKMKPRASPIPLRYRRVREAGMRNFKDRLAFSSERDVSSGRFASSSGKELLLPDLVEVWDYLRGTPALGSMADIQQGFQFLNEETLGDREVISKEPRPGWVKAILRAADDYSIYELPKPVWVDVSRENLRTPGPAVSLNISQVVVNYAPVAREPWRLKAALDLEGIAVASRFVVLRRKLSGPSLRVLWAILNSPVANAYAYCVSGKRETLVREWKSFPLPRVSAERAQAIETAAGALLAAAESASAFMQIEAKGRVKQALLSMDAEVLKLYDLPPRLERQLLDLFTGVERKGVDCDFRGYYPAGFTSYLPLHMIISEQFESAAANATADRFKPGESAYVSGALAAAAEARGM